MLGVDVGGVLIERAAEDDDTSFFGSRPMDTPAVDGAFAAVSELCTGMFAFRVHIVSKAGPRIAALTREWLDTKGFFEETGVPRSNLWFVRRREEKREECRRLAITHFVDDRLDVLTDLDNVAHRYLFTGGLGADPVPNSIPDDIEMCGTWEHVTRTIRSTRPR